MNAQIYIFLRGIINRWPLDSSFSVVLELWLSYIQPWRYTFERSQQGASAPVLDGQLIQRQYESFIKENMISYTQILVQLLPRFERLDFSSVKSVLMMYRLVKVFGQSNLAGLLRTNEFDGYASKISMSSPKKQFNGGNSFHQASQLSPRSANSSGIELMNDWGSYRSESLLQDDNYICLFGIEVHEHIRIIIEKMWVTREVERERAAHMEREQNQRYKGFLKYLKWFLTNDEDLIFQQALTDCKKIPDILDNMMVNLSNIFEVNFTR